MFAFYNNDPSFFWLVVMIFSVVSILLCPITLVYLVEYATRNEEYLERHKILDYFIKTMAVTVFYAFYISVAIFIATIVIIPFFQ